MTKPGKKIHKNMCPLKVKSRGTASKFARPRSFRLLSVGMLYIPWRIQFQLHIKRHITKALLMPVKPHRRIERVRRSLFRHVHAGGGYFENLL